jgi:hypothetical protein
MVKPAAAPAPLAQTLACPSCGSSLTVRASGHSVSIACGACGSVLDARDPHLAVIEQYQRKTKRRPKIPLGSRGKLKGELFEVIGFLVRRGKAGEETFSWEEYLLFNPYRGFRWLTEYQGHWILAKAASAHPKEDQAETQRAQHYSVSYLGESFRHFQKAQGEVEYVLGEFPWRVKVGERTFVEDYISPPRILSCERTSEETTWSIGEHIEGETLWKAFGMQGAPPAPQGVGVIQPSPFAPHTRNILRLLAAFIGAAFAIQFLFWIASQNRQVYSRSFLYQRGTANATVATEPFELTGRRSNVQVEIDTNLSNDWAYFNLALINEETGAGRNFGREVSYYSGYDDGAWSEGSRWDRVYLPSVPSGRYYLLIEPETSAPQLYYTLRVRRDVPRAMYTVLAAGLLALPALVFWFRKRSFEYQRWLESDHPMRSFRHGLGGDDDED